MSSQNIILCVMYTYITIIYIEREKKKKITTDLDRFARNRLIVNPQHACTLRVTVVNVRLYMLILKVSYDSTLKTEYV